MKDVIRLDPHRAPKQRKTAAGCKKLSDSCTKRLQAKDHRGPRRSPRIKLPWQIALCRLVPFNKNDSN
jgi:hypothetical protein